MGTGRAPDAVLMRYVIGTVTSALGLVLLSYLRRLYMGARADSVTIVKGPATTLDTPCPRCGSVLTVHTEMEEADRAEISVRAVAVHTIVWLLVPTGLLIALKWPKAVVTAPGYSPATMWLRRVASPGVVLAFTIMLIVGVVISGVVMTVKHARGIADTVRSAMGNRIIECAGCGHRDTVDGFPPQTLLATDQERLGVQPGGWL